MTLEEYQREYEAIEKQVLNGTCTVVAALARVALLTLEHAKTMTRIEEKGE